MTTYCEVTGRRPTFGKAVSHSHRRTNRRFDPNLQRKRFRAADRLHARHQDHRRPGHRGRLGTGQARTVGRLMARATDVRPVIKLKSTAGTGYTYVTRKNRRNDPDRLVLRKYDPVVRRHVEFKEER
jgi:large subunit ribosomal protein L33